MLDLMPLIDKIINIFNGYTDRNIDNLFYGIYLFGSTTHSTQIPAKESDIDVLVVGRDPLDINKYDILTNIRRDIAVLQKVEIAYVELDEINLLVSPALAQAWFAEGIKICGADIEILKKEVLEKVNEKEFVRAMLRRNWFDLYMCRQTIINGASRINSQDIRALAKAIVWTTKTKLVLEDKKFYSSTPQELIEHYMDTDNSLYNILHQLIVLGESIEDTDIYWKLKDKLYSMLQTNNELFIKRFNENAGDFNLRAV